MILRASSATQTIRKPALPKLNKKTSPSKNAKRAASDNGAAPGAPAREAARGGVSGSAPIGDPLWFKDAVIYELHVRSFFDSQGDGIGDFAGLMEKLDYLQDLGVTALWLLPFYPSPLRDDGYDIGEYTGIHPSYGTIRDFRKFLDEAHRRGLRVITELVINHTSDQHAWFKRARKANPGSRWRDFYVWSDTPDRYAEARIIFKDFETSNWTWDGEAKAYYWHRFYSHQPDLNYENPEVHKAIFGVLDFWLKMGVDGLRVDAVPYLYEEEGTNCENLAQTHEFVRKLRSHVQKSFPECMLLAEANQWPEDAVEYFGNDDEFQMGFHFPLMPRMFMALRMEDRSPIIDILEQTPAIPEGCQWATFLRNHDELTLEMVSDDERDYMYRVYAHDQQMRINVGIRRRLAPLLGNDRRAIELMNGLLFSLTGTPVLYYGDEIGMGDNIYLGDRNGVRTPMQWSGDRNAGFSKANSQRLYFPVITDPEYHYESVNVDAQQSNSSSLLWWMKRLIARRKRVKAFSRGTLEFLHPENRKVLAYLRRHEGETVLVVANLSRFVQYVELDLSEFKASRLVEMFGHTEFPYIGDLPFFLTLGPHSFYWFNVDDTTSEAGLPYSVAEPEDGLASIMVRGAWETIFKARARGRLEAVLPQYLNGCRWFGGKSRGVQSVTIEDAVPMNVEDRKAYIVVVNVQYRSGEPESYCLPLIYAEEPYVTQVLDTHPHDSIVCRLSAGGCGGLLHDALHDSDFCAMLLNAISSRRRCKGTHGTIVASGTHEFRSATRKQDFALLGSSVLKGEQSNSSVIYDTAYVLKLFRGLGEGLNPDLEIGRFLTENSRFAHIPAIAGAIEYEPNTGPGRTLAILQTYVPNEGEAWTLTVDSLKQFFTDALAQPPELLKPGGAHTGGSTAQLLDGTTSEVVQGMVGAYFSWVELLGRRTAEMHLALASDREVPEFAPEPWSKLYQRSVYQSLIDGANRAMRQLKRVNCDLPAGVQPKAEQLLDLKDVLADRFKQILKIKIDAERIRCHGDFHLGQVLHAGADICILDFEGEPMRSLGQRRLKRSPLVDVAGMIRSFHYAARAALADLMRGEGLLFEDRGVLEQWAREWFDGVTRSYLIAYLDAAGSADFLPTGRQELCALLDAFVLDKALYELGYELDNRPDWIEIPLEGIFRILGVD